MNSIRPLVILSMAGLFMAPASLAAVSGSSREKIIGGLEIEASHPLTRSVVALINIVEPEPEEAFEVCTASFLTDRVLLTAAHCLPETDDGGEPQALSIKIGVDAYDDGPRLKVDRVLAHPDYDSTTYVSDVAVIRLAESYSEAKPLKLARPQDLRGASLSRMSRVQAVGFGRSNAGRGENESYEGLGRMRTVDLQSIDFVSSSTSEELLIQVDMNHGRGFCEGDSGGPALLKAGRGKSGIIGVASTFESRGPKDCNQFGYYTNVLPHLEWIKRAMREIVK